MDWCIPIVKMKVSTEPWNCCEAAFWCIQLFEGPRVYIELFKDALRQTNVVPEKYAIEINRTLNWRCYISFRFTSHILCPQFNSHCFLPSMAFLIQISTVEFLKHVIPQLFVALNPHLWNLGKSPKFLNLKLRACWEDSITITTM